MNSETNKPRTYRRITAGTVAEFKALEVATGNGSAAVREQYPETISKGDRAFRIRKNSEKLPANEFIENQLQQIGIDAVNRLGMLVNSSDEKVAGVNTRYAIDQLRGKAVTKSVSLVGKVNIQSVLD